MAASPEDLLEDLFAHVAVDDAARRDIRARMAAPDRYYHGLNHLRTLWSRHRLYAASAGFNCPSAHRLVASAIAFHDVIYVPGRTDNEQRSAALWREMARPDLNGEELAWVEAAIIATADHSAAIDIPIVGMVGLLLWVVDLDLTPLGETADVFDYNAAQLALEHSSNDPSISALAQRRILDQFRGGAPLFRTPILAAIYDAPARRNIARALA